MDNTSRPVAVSPGTDTSNPSSFEQSGPVRAAGPSPQTAQPRQSHPGRVPPAAVNRAANTRWPVYLVVDLVLVLVFAAIGRSSHGEDLGGLMVTAWPFAAGALLGWLASRGTRRPAAVIPTGLTVWLCAEVGGMVLRALTGQGTAASFIVVSTIVLAVLLVGYRLVLTVMMRLRRR